MDKKMVITCFSSQRSKRRAGPFRDSFWGLRGFVSGFEV